MAMKERNQEDNLAADEEHLRQPRPIGDAGNDRARMSEVRSVKRKTMVGYEWVEALHSGTEVPNYDTYYMATTASNLGVTMSVHKDHVKEYVAQLQAMMATLSIYRQ